jgi:hypothetical protein
MPTPAEHANNPTPTHQSPPNTPQHPLATHYPPTTGGSRLAFDSPRVGAPRLLPRVIRSVYILRPLDPWGTWGTCSARGRRSRGPATTPVHEGGRGGYGARDVAVSYFIGHDARRLDPPHRSARNAFSSGRDATRAGVRRPNDCDIPATSCAESRGCRLCSQPAPEALRGPASLEHPPRRRNPPKGYIRPHTGADSGPAGRARNVQRHVS